MAKRPNTTDEEDLMKNAAENPNEEHTEETARSAEEVQITTNAKKVQIQVVEKVDCIVAGVAYKLNKDKAYKVPSDVAAILCNAKKAYRI